MRIVAALLLAGAWVHADTVVLRDRTVLSGTASRTGDRLLAGGSSHPLTEVLLWEDDEGTPRYAPTLSDHLAACHILAERERLSRCLERLPKAVEDGAGPVAWNLLATAAEAGLDPSEEKSWRKKLRKLGKGSTKVTVPGAEVLTGILVARAQAAFDDEQSKRSWELLRVALDRDKENEDARDLLDEMAPDNWRVGDPYTKRLWLDWHIDVIQEGMRAVGRRQPDIQRARQLWRDEKGNRIRLWGAQTQEIVFITHLEQSQIVSMCTKYAWLSCKALDTMFKTDDPQRDDNLPLVIWFFENKQDYVRVNSGGRGGGFLAMTAGFYSAADNTSRFFWIPGNARSVRDTFVHELTHHWIQRRNPRLHPKDLERSVEVPGYWVVEGFATFIEEGRYDIRRNTWTHFNPQANSLDIVADLSKQKKLIGWKKLYGLNQIDFRNPEKLGQKSAQATVQKTWGIRPQPISQIRLFYEQSAATCHFLYWGEGGKYREQLLNYVTWYYSAQKDKTGIEAAFGLKPEELGRRVEKFATDVMNGWKPG